MTNVFRCSLLWFALTVLAGCAWHAKQSESPDSSSEAAATSEATATPGNSATTASTDASSNAEAKPHGDTDADTAAQQQASVQANLNRLFLEKPGTEETAGNAIAPGGMKLLNDKAEHFSQFTRPLLQRLYLATEDVERERLARNGVPSELRPVIIEATLNSDGELTELVLQQLSGSGAVDQAMIQACKQGLWMRNPPVDARDPDGNYRFRIEATIKNFMRPTEFADWMLRTHIGLALE